MNSTNTLKVILAFAAIYIIWGSTFLAIAFGIDTIPPFLLAGARFVITGLLFLGWMWFKGIKMPKWSEVKAASISGVFLFVGGNASVVWAEKYIASGVAAIIIASMPLWFVIFDRTQLRKLKTDKMLGTGLLLGFAGVLILTGLDDLIAGRLDAVVIIGYTVLLLAPISWVIGTLYAKKESHPVSLTAKIGIQSLAGGLVTLVFSLFAREYAYFEIAQVSMLSAASLLYLIVFGTIIAFSSYAWLIQIKPATQVGTYAYVNPIIAVGLGWLLRNEPLTTNVLLGLIVILTGVFMVNYSFMKEKRLARAGLNLK